MGGAHEGVIDGGEERGAHEARYRQVVQFPDDVVGGLAVAAEPVAGGAGQEADHGPPEEDEEGPPGNGGGGEEPGGKGQGATGGISQELVYLAKERACVSLRTFA